MSTQDAYSFVDTESIMAILSPLELMVAAPEMVENEKPKTKDITLKKETMKNLLKRDVPKPETILAPWLCVGESALVSAKAGVGKTFFGMEVAKAITLTGSAMAVYATIGYTVIDKTLFDRFDGGFMFEFLDESGNPWPGGAYGGGGTKTLDESFTRFEQQCNLQAVSTLPNKVILRAYKCWDKVRFETHTFEME